MSSSFEPTARQSGARAVVAAFIENEKSKRKAVVGMVSPLAISTANAIADWMLIPYTHVLDNTELDRLLNDPKLGNSS